MRGNCQFKKATPKVDGCCCEKQLTQDLEHNSGCTASQKLHKAPKHLGNSFIFLYMHPPQENYIMAPQINFSGSLPGHGFKSVTQLGPVELCNITIQAGKHF